MISFIVIDAMNDDLVRGLSYEEVKKVVFGLETLKAFGLDGFSFFFGNIGTNWMSIWYRLCKKNFKMVSYLNQ